MILSKILSKKLVYKTILSKKFYKRSLENLKLDLETLSSQKLLSKFSNNRKAEVLGSKIISNKILTKTSPIIDYIININLSLTNTLVCVTNTDGKVLLSFSSGLVNLTKRQKKTQPMALINIFKVLLIKAGFLKNKPVALHFKNTKSFYESTVIKILKDKLFIKTIQSYNLVPHNGCRPKKLKRIKRRTKRMVLR